MRYLVLLVPFAVVAIGCTTTPAVRSVQTYKSDGSVSSEIVDRESGAKYEVQPGETYLREVPRRENIRPAYPPQRLVDRLEPVEVIVRIVVSKSGFVDNAEVVDPQPSHAEFSDSVLNAVRTWSFIPLQRVTGNKMEPLPFTQDYKFTFTQVNGRAEVTQGSAPES